MKKRLRNFFTKGYTEAGCDEAGRGCLAGPVCASAVILPLHFRHSLLNDSKVMSEEQRDELRIYIEEKALAWAVGWASPAEIDEINILNASFVAMHRAIDQLQLRPQQLLIDGNRFKAYANLPHQCIVKGDGKFKNIAAASVLAKTHRDAYMKKLGEKFPQYEWPKNKGYGTQNHCEALERYGRSPYHRLSFSYRSRQQALDL